MGKVGTFEVSSLIFAVMVVVSASSRSLLSDEKATPSPAPVDHSLAKSNLPESVPPPLANKLEKRPSSDDKSNTTVQELNPSPSNPALSPKSNDKIQQNTTGDSLKKVDDRVSGTENSSGSPLSPYGNTTKMQKENCNVPLTKCTIDTLFACLQLDETKNYLLLIQNSGQSTLNVSMKGTPPLKIDADTITLSKGSSNKILIPKNQWNGTNIVLNAGKGDCNLQMARQFSIDWELFPQIPAPIPIYGAYLLVFVVVFASGIWACCKYTRGERHDAGVPYQQLEMGAQPKSSSVVEDGNTGVGWDDGWDNDWDEEAVTQPEAATISSEKLPVSVSSNGLTSKAQDKDGWDADWDD